MKASEKIQLLLKGVSKSEIAELEAQEQEELEKEKQKKDPKPDGSEGDPKPDGPEESEESKELKKQIEIMIKENDDLKAQLADINSKSTQKKEPEKRDNAVDVFRELFNNEKTEK